MSDTIVELKKESFANSCFPSKLTRVVAVVICATPFCAWAACETATTQEEVNRCADSEYRQVSQSLETLTDAYEHRLTPAQIVLFRKTQADWENYRRSACEFATSGVKDGSVYPLAMTVCLSSKVRERISEVEALLNCQEGTALCPAWKSGH